MILYNVGVPKLTTMPESSDFLVVHLLRHSQQMQLNLLKKQYLQTQDSVVATFIVNNPATIQR